MHFIFIQLCHVVLHAFPIWSIEILNLILFLTDNLGLVLPTLDGTAYLLKAHGTLNWPLLDVFESFLLLTLFIEKLRACHDKALYVSSFCPHSWAFDSLEALCLATSWSFFSLIRTGRWHYFELRIVKPLLWLFVYLVIFAAVELTRITQSETLVYKA